MIVFFDVFGYYIRLVGYIPRIYHYPESNESSRRTGYWMGRIDIVPISAKTMTAAIDSIAFVRARGSLCDAAGGG
ncbi:MAG: hypothetical protein LBJ76_05175, partial [Candidatus Accumulibacter sp.]|nr:hypothetical protein [Accumulibacter sp.]